jgi:hypothetical protein
MPGKRRHCVRLHPELSRRVEDIAVLEERTVTSVVEQVLAEYLYVPVADPTFPEAPVEICHECRRGVVWLGRCPLCHWRRRRPRHV